MQVALLTFGLPIDGNSIEKARNFLAKDGPGSFDQSIYSISIYSQIVNIESRYQLGIPSCCFGRGVFLHFFEKSDCFVNFLSKLLVFKLFLRSKRV